MPDSFWAVVSLAQQGLILLHLVLVITFAVRVISQRLPVGASLAWLLVLALLPYVGVGLYLLFGERFLGVKHQQRRARLQQLFDIPALRNTPMVEQPWREFHPASQALAQECNPSDVSQTGMTICANANFRVADAKLNKAYAEIVRRLAHDAEGKRLLQTVQRAWIAFRDAECAFSANDSKGGSIYPMLISECLEELTNARAEQLKGDLGCKEGDISCSVPPAQ